MNKINLLIIVLTVIGCACLIGVGVIWFLERPSLEGDVVAVFEKVAETGKIKFCEKIPDYYEECIIFAAQVKKEAKLCGKLTDSLYEECLLKVAEQTLDPELCKVLSDELLKNKCFKSVVALSHDPELCAYFPLDNSPYTRAECFFNVGVAASQAALCKDAEEFSDPCYLHVALENWDLEQCKSIQETEMRDFCFYYLSVQSSKVRPCHLIETDPLYTLCVAQVNLNPDFCELLKDFRIRKLCQREVAFQMSAPELCQQDLQCLIDIALKQDDEKICGLTLTDDSKDRCKFFLAIRNKREEICGELKDLDLKADCFVGLAFLSGNPDYCDNLEGEIKQKVCVEGVAGITGNIKVCEKFTDKADLDSCLQDVFQNEKLSNVYPQLCETIEDDFLKAKCYYVLGMTLGEYDACLKIKQVFPNEEYWNEKGRLCIENALDVLEAKYLKKPFIEQKPGKRGPIVVKAQAGESMTHLANRAFNIFLTEMTPEEKSQVDFSITLGHRVFIEDYIASQMENYITEGQEISFPRELILEAISASKSLTEQRLQVLSQYAFGEGSINLPLFEIKGLSYCVFKTELLSHYESYYKGNVGQVLCAVKLTGNYELCEKMEEQVQRKQCYEGISELTLNYMICERFEKAHNKSFCYQNFAVSQESTDICRKIEESYLQDTCIYSVALKQEASLQICEEIADDFFRGNCYKKLALEKDDALLCESISGTNSRTWCYIELAEKRGDVALCEKIQEETPALTESFKNTCYSKVGNKDPAYCASSSDYEGRVLCYIKHYEDYKHQYTRENCFELSNLDKDFCYVQQAESRGESTICENIKIGEIADYCFSLVFLKTESPLCEKIISRIYRDSCLLDFAQRQRDYTLCHSIENSFERNKCFNNIANLLEDKTPCQFVSQESALKKNCGNSFQGLKEKYINTE